MKIRTVLCAMCLLPAATYAQAASQYREIVINSRELGSPRRIWIKLPANYPLHNRRLPLTIVLDGNDRRILDLVAASAQYNSTLDALDPDIPEQIVVGIESRDRGREFGSGAAVTMRFIERELVPELQRRYRIEGPHVIVGHSLGGAFALDLMCASKNTFRAVVAISPAIADPVDAERVTRCLRRISADHSAFLAVGSRAGDGTEDQFRSNILAVIQAVPSSHIRLLELPGVSHSRTPLFGIPGGLDYVNTEWERGAVDSLRASLLRGGIDPVAALDSIAMLRKRAGIAGVIPARWYHITTLLLAGGGRPSEAIRIAKVALASYPERSELYQVLGDACAKMHDDACVRSAAQKQRH